MLKDDILWEKTFDGRRPLIEVDLCVYIHCPGLSMTVSFLVSFTNIAYTFVDSYSVEVSYH